MVGKKTVQLSSWIGLIKGPGFESYQLPDDKSSLTFVPARTNDGFEDTEGKEHFCIVLSPRATR